ncbi:MAG: alanyl-tRNA editing protein [Rhizobiales bacterium]|nr:alanyl-tRNA editing protein [Hyphomicrobiales bacterium]
MTIKLFVDDAYLKTCDAEIIAVNERGGIILDQTIFYATGGGQPGDSGWLTTPSGERIEIATSVYDEDRQTIIHVPTAPIDGKLTVGDRIKCEIDWDIRHPRMRIHTALHLLSAILPYPVTGGSVSDGTGRLDFDIQDASLADKEELTTKLMTLVSADHQLSTEWITDEELDANPELVKTMSVQPPRGSGRIRLLRIGDNVDLQPCGGTHVRSTGEIGPVLIKKIEKKGRQNRRVRIALV